MARIPPIPFGHAEEDAALTWARRWLAGNWSFPCQSHYWIEGNRVRWTWKMSANQIAAVRRRDRRAAERLVAEGRPAARFRQGLAAIWAKVVSMFKPKR